MAVTLTDLRTTLNEADSTTGWTGTTTLLTADPTPIESTGCLGANVGIEIFDSYFGTTAIDLTNSIVYAWVYPRSVMGNTTDTNGGLMIHLGDGTDRIGFKVAGSDVAGFRHDTGPTSWQNVAFDVLNIQNSLGELVRAGSLANLDTSSITQIGTTVNSLVAAPGMNPTYVVDIIRIFSSSVSNDGCAIGITGGTSGTPGTFAEMAAEDRATGSLKAHGIIRQLGVGAFGVQGPIRFGESAGAGSSWFEDRNVSVIFEDRNFLDSRYKFYITDNGTGTTTFILGTKIGTGASALGSEGVTLTSPPGVGAQFDSQTDTDVTDVFIYGSTFNGFSNRILLGGSSQEFIGNIVNSSGTVISLGANMINSSFNACIESSSVFWNINTNPSGALAGCSFLGSGSAGQTKHAIEFGPSVPTSMSLYDVTYTNYDVNEETVSSSIYNNSGKDLQISIFGGDIPTVRNAGGFTTTLVTAQRTLTLNSIVSGSEVSLVNRSTGAEIDHLEDVNTDGLYTYTYSYTGDLPVFAYVHNIEYVWQAIPITLLDQDQTLTVQQVFDRNYSNP